MTGAPTPDPPGNAYKVALVFGIIVGTVDLLVGPAQVASTLIVIFAFILSLAYPHHAWQWALLIAVFVPLAHVLARLGNYTNPSRPDNFYIHYFAFIPAFIGGYLAVFLRWMGDRRDSRG